MSYNDVFGGGSINPSQRTYLELTISADVQLQWPIEQQIGGDDVAVDIIDVDATIAGLNIDFDDARQVSTGYTTLFTNIGSNSVTIRDSGGGTILSLITGVTFFIYLTDNSTAAGVWRVFQLGSLMTAANAALLAGAGLKAIAATLNQTIPPTIVTVTPLDMTDADRAQLNIWNAGVGTFNLPNPGTVGSDWFTHIRNDGSGVLTVNTPAGVIDDGGSLMLNPGVSGTFVTDGTDWFTIGLTSSLDTGFDFTEIDVSGSGDFVLSGVQLDRVAYRFIGTLTGDRSIIVPSTIQEYWVDNSTTGAFSLFVKTAPQITPVEIPQGNRAILYCNGTDVVDAESSVVTFPITISQGGTGATTAPGARTNLGVPPTTRLVDTGVGLSGGGNLNSDQTHNLDYTGIPVEVPVVGDFITFQDIDDSDDIKKVSIADFAASVPPVELVDTAANVRVRAELLGIVQLRSDDDVDASVRVLEFAHSDASPVALVGQPGATLDFVIAHLINDAAANITMALPPLTQFKVEVANIPHLRVIAGGVRFQGTANNNAEVFWEDTSGVARASIGFDSNAVLTFKNLIESGSQAIRFEGEATGPVTVTLMEMNPDNDIALFDEGIEVAHTVPPADGGFEVDNQNTGAGFERVLTTADLGGGGAPYRGCKAFRTFSIGWPRDDAPNSTFTGPTQAAVAIQYNAEVLDTDAIHDIAVLNTRFTVPAGVSKARMRGAFRMAGLLGAGVGIKHVLVRRNGSTTITIDPGQTSWIPLFSQEEGAGTGSNWGWTGFDTGIIEVTPTDFFEVFILTQAGNATSLANQAWCEFEIVE